MRHCCLWYVADYMFVWNQEEMYNDLDSKMEIILRVFSAAEDCSRSRNWPMCNEMHFIDGASLKRSSEAGKKFNIEIHLRVDINMLREPLGAAQQLHFTLFPWIISVSRDSYSAILTDYLLLTLK